MTFKFEVKYRNTYLTTHATPNTFYIVYLTETIIPIFRLISGFTTFNSIIVPGYTRITRNSFLLLCPRQKIGRIIYNPERELKLALKIKVKVNLRSVALGLHSS